MIKFDRTKVSFELVQLKTITTALGGALTHLVDGIDKPVRIEIPTAVARAFIERHKMSKYLKPAPTMLMRYDGRVISIERHGLSSLANDDERLFQDTKWVSKSETNFKSIIDHIDQTDRQWYIDGRYLYSFQEGSTPYQHIKQGDYLTKNGQFRKLAVDSYDLQKLFDESSVTQNPRSCLAFVIDHKNFAISSPIWKDVDEIRCAGESDQEQDMYAFDDIDTKFRVNLNFALSCGSKIGKLFNDYHVVEPLQLPRLMIELTTVNLPSIPKHVKSTYDIGMPPSHACAWLMGMVNKVDNLNDLAVVRSLLKYLFSKGMYDASTTKKENIYIDPTTTVDDIPKLDVHEYAKQYKFEMRDWGRTIADINKRKSSIINNTLIDDEDDDD